MDTALLITLLQSEYYALREKIETITQREDLFTQYELDTLYKMINNMESLDE